MSGPLDRLRVVELAEMVSGPHMGKLFAALGADVVKVEPPGGDRGRRQPPFPSDRPDSEASGLFLYHNTGKRSITLDIGTATGGEVLRRLVAAADVFIENHAPGQLASMGFGYEDLREINPRLVYVSVTPFGQTGPYRDYRATDLGVFALSGVSYYTFTMADEGDPPSHGPGSISEVLAGQTAAAAAMAALFHRDITGAGQWVDISAMDSLANNAKMEAAPVFYAGTAPSRFLKDVAVPMQPEPAQDAYIYAMMANDAHWEGTKAAMGHPEWAETELLATIGDRIANQDYQRMMLNEWYAQHPAEYLVEQLQANGVTAGPVYDIPSAMSHPTSIERGLFVEVDHPVAGRVTLPGPPARMSKTPFETGRAPLLGEHTVDILKELGYSSEDMVALSASGAL